MKKLIVANWKLNPLRETDAIRLARVSDRDHTVICPPFVFLESVGKTLRRAKLGAQDAFWKESGPYTGEASPVQLKRLGVSYALIGHSSRRTELRETDAMINKKIRAALRAGLKVILCVGEPWNVRRKGLPAAKSFVRTQLQKDLAGIRTAKPTARNLIVAYEPIWAIGTGRADAPHDTIEISKFIKNLLAARYSLRAAKVLYGGSMTSRNAKSFVQYKEIDGALVGGASLKAEEIRTIISIAAQQNGNR